jgi:glucose-1-phosphate thymidylyltransferase
MKAVLMAGGFAKRLGFPNKSKCLIEIGGKPIIDYTLEKLKEISEINEIIVITNDTFYKDFTIWSRSHSYMDIKIRSDGGTKENSKIGALTALLNFLEEENLEEDLFLAGADNFFKFSLKDIYRIFRKESHDLAVFYDIKNREKAKRFGVALINSDNIITDFEEKPTNPQSTIVSSCMYFFKKETIPLIKELSYK